MSDGPFFVERIDYVAARDAMRRMDDLIMEGGPGAEGLGEIDVVMATIEAALVGVRDAEVDWHFKGVHRRFVTDWEESSDDR